MCKWAYTWVDNYWVSIPHSKDHLMLDYMTQHAPNVLLGFFLFSQSDDHPYKDLTKSGYKLNMKQKSLINLLYF
jgi:hypothetical protein